MGGGACKWRAGSSSVAQVAFLFLESCLVSESRTTQKELELELKKTHPYDTEASSAGRSVGACVARESKNNEVGSQVRWAQAPGGVGVVWVDRLHFLALPRGG